ncbi:hypothetical protein C2E23DRAFT_881029 [Lenzites betulinus]|nr:hypothetical protein C2E23DRAFT_881029 [Lenzites betulinus]
MTPPRLPDTTRATQPRSFKTPHTRDIPPHFDTPLILVDESDDFPSTWATDITRFSTLFGAHTLTPYDLQALKSVPRERTPEMASVNVRITRTRAMIEDGQKIAFSFQAGPKHLAGKGIPVYALAMTSKEELGKHISLAREQVMKSFGLKRVLIRIQWPFSREEGFDLLTFEEWVKVDASTTRLQLAMLTADVFRQFFEVCPPSLHRISSIISSINTSDLAPSQKHRMPLAALANYPWLLKPDAFYRVWLVGLERVESNVFAVDMTYVKDHPSHTYSNVKA